MGSVKIDTNKSAHKHDVVYAYLDAGIERLLNDIYRIQADIDRGDVDALCIRCDLEQALQSRCLTPRQRQCVALYYFACLTQEDCAAVLGISQQAVQARLETAIPAISERMAGFNIVAPQLTAVDMRDHTPMMRWMTDAAMNESRWWDVPADVWREINANLGYVPAANVVNDDYPYFPQGHKSRSAWRREVLMDAPENRPKSLSRYERKEVDGDVVTDLGAKWPRYPSDSTLKKYGNFLTYKRNTQITTYHIVKAENGAQSG